jgi:hypothetical protein
VTRQAQCNFSVQRFTQAQLSYFLHIVPHFAVVLWVTGCIIFDHVAQDVPTIEVWEYAVKPLKCSSPTRRWSEPRSVQTHPIPPNSSQIFKKFEDLG